MFEIYNFKTFTKIVNFLEENPVNNNIIPKVETGLVNLYIHYQIVCYNRHL